MTSFSGLSAALSALHAQRRGLDVTGQNVANANTEGYTRQRVQMQSISGNTVPAVWSVSNGTGGGVTASGLQRLRDEFLEARGRSEHAQHAYLVNQQGIYANIENIFAEPSDTAIQARLADFWGAWGDVANRPNDLAARTALLHRGAVAADGLKNAYESLTDYWDTARSQFDAYVIEVNSSAQAIADLNQAIQRGQSTGLPVSEMADQRDLQLMRLAKLTGAVASVRTDGTVDVHLGGSALVTGVNARRLETAGADRLEDQLAAANPADHARLRWADTGATVAAGGTLGSMNETLTAIIPRYAVELDTVAGLLVSTVNQRHMTGYGLDGGTGRPFFDGTRANDLRVALTDTAQVAAAGTSGSLDGSNADALAAFARRADGADKRYRETIANLGVLAQSVDRREKIQAMVVRDVDTARAAESGVSLDEEMTQLLSYQRAYEAASRVLTTVDAMLDQLINRTGLVGR